MCYFLDNVINIFYPAYSCRTWFIDCGSLSFKGKYYVTSTIYILCKSVTLRLYKAKFRCDKPSKWRGRGSNGPYRLATNDPLNVQRFQFPFGNAYFYIIKWAKSQFLRVKIEICRIISQLKSYQVYFLCIKCLKKENRKTEIGKAGVWEPRRSWGRKIEKKKQFGLVFYATKYMRELFFFCKN